MLHAIKSWLHIDLPRPRDQTARVVEGKSTSPYVSGDTNIIAAFDGKYTHILLVTTTRTRLPTDASSTSELVWQNTPATQPTQTGQTQFGIGPRV